MAARAGSPPARSGWLAAIWARYAMRTWVHVGAGPRPSSARAAATSTIYGTGARKAAMAAA